MSETTDSAAGDRVRSDRADNGLTPCRRPATPDADDASEHHPKCYQRTGVPADLRAGSV